VVKSFPPQNKLGLADLSGVDAVDSSGLGSSLGEQPRHLHIRQVG